MKRSSTLDIDIDTHTDTHTHTDDRHSHTHSINEVTMDNRYWNFPSNKGLVKIGNTDKQVYMLGGCLIV